MTKDWVGNASIRVCNTRRKDAEPNDYYATDPRAVELLLEQETFAPVIWEPACGEGHIAKVLEAHGHTVRSTDLIYRGYGDKVSLDFLKHPRTGDLHIDIITNPPYKYAKEFVEQALDMVAEGQKVAMFLKLTFLEGKGRRSLFREHPPQTVYVSSSRLECGKNGEFVGASAVAYAWYVWQKGYSGPANLKWIN